MPRKNAVPVLRTCEVCGTDWTPRSRFQARRNKTCSPECNARRISICNKGRVRATRTPCALCGERIYRAPSHRDRNEKTYCSHSCRAKAHAEHLKPFAGNMKGRRGRPVYGEKNPAWKGGVTYRNRKGNYVSVKYVRCPDHLRTMARADGYVMEHRLVMAEWIGRPLTRTECVHHIDHAPLNNPRSNLELCPDNRSHKLAEHGKIAVGAANRLFLTG